METSKKSEKVPKRVIHFSDGAVPEYSTDEDEAEKEKPIKTVHIDPASLNWTHWLRFKSVEFGSAALNVCDYLGDSLSSFFGITTPKYQFEIDHYNMMKQMEREISDTEMGMVKSERAEENSKKRYHENVSNTKPVTNDVS